jgi:hypothetical protein
MVQATEVFTPTNVPTLTYVERASRNFESDLRTAFTIPKMIVSISGPSKSGKTVLVTKVVAPENLIHIYGASIKRPDDLWSNVLTWMGGPLERTETEGSKLMACISCGEIEMQFARVRRWSNSSYRSRSPAALMFCGNLWRKPVARRTQCQISISAA